MEKAQTIDEYIAQFPDVQDKLQQMRGVILDASPENTAEKISWAMPTFYLYGNLVHFAAHKSHIGFYPGTDAVETFAEELAAYKTSKGAVQFPYTDELPVDLITRIVQFCSRENIKKYEQSGKHKTIV